MKIDTVVLVGVAVVGLLVVAAYFIGLIAGVIATGGLLLPALLVFIGVVAVGVIVVRQRLSNAEDDHYDKIER